MPFDATPLPAVNPVVELLEAGLARIEKGWCQGANGRDGYGNIVGGPYLRMAVSFCAGGAVSCDRKNTHSNVAINYLWRTISLDQPGINIPTWNDYPGRTKDDVIRLYQRAIEIAKAEVFENAI
jgi:hypothetical protein